MAGARVSLGFFSAVLQEININAMRLILESASGSMLVIGFGQVNLLEKRPVGVCMFLPTCHVTAHSGKGSSIIDTRVRVRDNDASLGVTACMHG